MTEKRVRGGHERQRESEKEREREREGGERERRGGRDGELRDAYQRRRG